MPISFNEAYPVLSKSRLLHNYSKQQCEMLYNLCKEELFSNGKYIIREQDPFLDFFIVLEGQVEIVKTQGQHNKPLHLTTLYPSECFGAMELPNTQSNEIAVLSKANSILLSISYKDLKMLSEKDPEFVKLLNPIIITGTEFHAMNTPAPTILQQTFLFRGIPEEHAQKLIRMGREIHFPSRAFIIQEGEKADDLFVILSGRIEIIKSDPISKELHSLALLGPGDTIGEIALIDEGVRSATVRTLEATQVIAFKIDDIRQLAKNDPTFFPVLTHIARTLSAHLRHVNGMLVNTLQHKVDQYKGRLAIGNLLLGVIFGLCTYALIMSAEEKLADHQSIAHALSYLQVLAYSAFAWYFLKYTPLPIKTFGFTLENWSTSLKESFLFSLPICFLMLLTKWILIHTPTSSFYAKPFFDYYGIVLNLHYHILESPSLWWLGLVAYSLYLVPIQEIVVRGGLQSCLQLFLSSRYNVLWALLISNFLFATLHTSVSFNMSIATFALGMFWGWLYHRQKTLIGPCLSHIMIGILGFWVLGLV